MVDQQNGDALNGERDENAERRERVVGTVLQRIAAAPRVGASPDTSGALVNLAAWRVHAIAAAAVLIIASGTVILTTEQAPPPDTVATSAGSLPAPVAHYLQTGVVAPMEWLNRYGGRP